MEKLQIPEALLTDPIVTLGDLAAGGADLSISEQVTPASSHTGTQADPVAGQGPRYTPGAMELTEGLQPDF